MADCKDIEKMLEAECESNATLRARVAELERRLNFNTTNGGCEACDATFNAPCAYHQGEIAGKESAESRLTQLEGVLRNLRNQVQGANAIAHHEILAAIGVTNARCIERALAEADAALTPVVKQEPTK